MIRFIKIAGVAILAALFVWTLGGMPAHANGSDAPTPYTVDSQGVTLPAGTTFPAHGHVNINGSAGGAGIHFDPNNGHPGGQWIGQSFIPWSAFGLECGDTVTWVQVSLYNEHYGEGGQPTVSVYCEPSDPPAEPPVKPEPMVTTDTKTVKDCDAQIITTVLTTTTTDWVLVDNVWVEGEPVVTVTSSEAPTTADDCPPGVIDPPVCHEDMPCWDCETMGNKQCGPGVIDPPATTTTLAATGSDNSAIGWVLGVLAVLIGVAILVARIIVNRKG